MFLVPQLQCVTMHLRLIVPYKTHVDGSTHWNSVGSASVRDRTNATTVIINSVLGGTSGSSNSKLRIKKEIIAIR